MFMRFTGILVGFTGILVGFHGILLGWLLGFNVIVLVYEAPSSAFMLARLELGNMP